MAFFASASATSCLARASSCSLDNGSAATAGASPAASDLPGSDSAEARAPWYRSASRNSFEEIRSSSICASFGEMPPCSRRALNPADSGRTATLSSSPQPRTSRAANLLTASTTSLTRSDMKSGIWSRSASASSAASFCLAVEESLSKIFFRSARAAASPLAKAAIVPGTLARSASAVTSPLSSTAARQSAVSRKSSAKW